jgi:hypothetical protein
VPWMSSWQVTSSVVVAAQRVVPSGRRTSTTGFSAPDVLTARIRTRSPAVAPNRQQSVSPVVVTMPSAAVVANGFSVQPTGSLRRWIPSE